MNRLLLQVWSALPLPWPVRRLLMRVVNPAVIVGAMALIQDEQGRILLLEHTYRRQTPWGLPGGWLKRAENPEVGVAREVFEETGYEVEVQELVAADFFGGGQFDLMYRCRVIGGTFRTTAEASRHHWAEPDALPELLPNQIMLLRKAGILGSST